MNWKLCPLERRMPELLFFIWISGRIRSQKNTYFFTVFFPQRLENLSHLQNVAHLRLSSRFMGASISTSPGLIVTLRTKLIMLNAH